MLGPINIDTALRITLAVLALASTVLNYILARRKKP